MASNLKNIFSSHKYIIVLKNREMLRKFRRITKDWDKYIVILEEESEIIVPQKLLNRKIVKELRYRGLILGKETTSKYENGRKITLHFWRIKLIRDFIEAIKSNPNLIDIKIFIEREVKNKCLVEFFDLILKVLRLENRLKELLRETTKLKELEEIIMINSVIETCEDLGIEGEYVILLSEKSIHLLFKYAYYTRKDVREVIDKIREKIKINLKDIYLTIQEIKKSKRKIREYGRKLREYYYKFFNLY